ncbi:MAG: hypothetical protein ACLQDY_14070 [Streptosporangiaceae bacterium]
MNLPPPEQVAELSAQQDRPRTVLAAIDWRAVRTADRSCCCAAKPAYIAVLPPAEGREHATELLLCGHHCRASRAALAETGAVVLDERGVPVTVADLAAMHAG